MQIVGDPAEILVDIRSEQALLSALLVSYGHPLDCRTDVMEYLGSDGESVFHDQRHQIIYRALVARTLAEQPSDVVGVIQELRLMGALKAGLDDYVMRLPSMASVQTGALLDAEHVLELYRKRELRRIVRDADATLSTGEGSFEDVAGQIYQDVSDAVEKTATPDTMLSSSALLEKALGHLYGGREVVKGISTGLYDIDRMTGGMRPGQMWVIAGRPAMGKTTLAMQIGRYVARVEGKGVAVFSLEMPSDELGQRNAAGETSIAFQKIRDGKLTPEELAVLTQYVGESQDDPLYVEDIASQTIGEIGLKARRMVRQHDVKVVIVDYLQIVKPNTPMANREREVSSISDGLRTLAKSLGITIIAVAQLNRASTSREDSKPKVSDLRDSGQIEQDANVIILTHLPFKLEEGLEPKAVVIIGKCRQGTTGDTEFWFDGPCNRFLDPSANFRTRERQSA